MAVFVPPVPALLPPPHRAPLQVPLDIDRRRKLVAVGGRTVRLTPRELALLVHLVEHPDRVHSRGQLLQQVWGLDRIDAEGTRTVDVHVARLRRKVGAHYRDHIQTVHGVGYRFRSVRRLGVRP